jgi:hypothetical protein
MSRTSTPIRYLSPEEALRFVMSRSQHPDPLVDKRELIEDTRTSRRLMGINRGRHITSPSQSGLWRGGRYWTGWERRPSTVGPVEAARIVAPITRRERARRWGQRERPAQVSSTDWELLRLVMVEQIRVPALVKLPIAKGLRVDAVRKRIQRARAAVEAAK